MITFNEATNDQLLHCAKYIGADEFFDIWSAPRIRIVKLLLKFGYKGIDASNPDWIIPVK